jgi:Uma2 family endonuclease
MVSVGYPVPQKEPSTPPRSDLPTMYDLPSENPEEPGLPDEFHALQPRLLSETFHPPKFLASQIFSASDMNLYYDDRHPLWYKRPDWFGVVGGTRFYDETELRLSYVIWQEGINPLVIVELLSPGTEKEDLGDRKIDRPISGNGKELEIEQKPPGKWEVYEKILRIPYYLVFSRYTDELRVFRLIDGYYQEIDIEGQGIWIEELGLGLGLWQGEYEGLERLWLCWYDASGSWIPTKSEQIEQQRQRAEQKQQQLEQKQQQLEQKQQQLDMVRQQAEQERQRAEQKQQQLEQAESKLAALLQRLQDSGIDPSQFENG